MLDPAFLSFSRFVRRSNIQDTTIQDQADQLKEHVQEFTDQVLEMTDTPHGSGSSSPSRMGHDRGHGSHFFSSMGGRHQQHGERTERFQGAYVDEPLIPALIYIAVAGMAGSIVARKSNFVFRFLSPVALALGASAYCIPKTTNNVLHSLRTFDYREMTHEWQHRYLYAKKSVVDTTHELTAVAGSLAHEAKDTVHDLSDKTHELADKTQKVMKDAKDKTIEVVRELKDTGEDVTEEVKQKSKDLGHQLDNVKEQAENKVEDKADQTKRWWNSEMKNAEQSAKDLKRSARETGEQVRDWAQSTGEESRDWIREKANDVRDHGFNKEDVERGFDRFKSKARQGWDSAKDEAQGAWSRGERDMSREFQERGRDMRRGAEQMQDQAEEWVEDGSRQWRHRFEDMKDRGEDWAQDRRRDFQKLGRDAEDQFEQTRDDMKRRGKEARDFSEDRFRDSGRDIHDKAKDIQDRGRRQFQRFERDFEDDRTTAGAGFGAGWGWGSERPGYDDGRRRRFEEREEYAGRGGHGFDSEMPRRSVTEAAREGKHWWNHKNPADPYESAPKDQARDQFDQAKYHAQRGMEDLKDSVEEKAQNGRSWLADKTNDMKHRFDHGKQKVENELHEKFAHSGYRGEQGRDMQDFGHNHASIYSHDNWFHYDHGEDNRASFGRGGERGM
ncbi:hypothetical protein EDD21DRAFT_384488 [Dissophora ornata]|nr:hypothetical protein EDD21DRAFT_384488 [Dissophora ornata]